MHPPPSYHDLMSNGKRELHSMPSSHLHLFRSFRRIYAHLHFVRQFYFEVEIWKATDSHREHKVSQINKKDYMSFHIFVEIAVLIYEYVLSDVK